MFIIEACTRVNPAIAWNDRTHRHSYGVPSTDTETIVEANDNDRGLNVPESETKATKELGGEGTRYNARGKHYRGCL